jgi:hypothetical protein
MRSGMNILRDSVVSFLAETYRNSIAESWSVLNSARLASETCEEIVSWILKCDWDLMLKIPAEDWFGFHFYYNLIVEVPVLNMTLDLITKFLSEIHVSETLRLALIQKAERQITEEDKFAGQLRMSKIPTEYK